MARAWCFETAGRLVFGAGTLARVGELLTQLRSSSCLVVSDINLTGPVEVVERAAAAAGIECHTFMGCQPEPRVDLVTELRNRPETAATPILMVTTRSVKEDILQAVNAGVNSYIVKPFTPQVLKEKIDEVMAQMSQT